MQIAKVIGLVPFRCSPVHALSLFVPLTNILHDTETFTRYNHDRYEYHLPFPCLLFVNVLLRLSQRHFPCCKCE